MGSGGIVDYVGAGELCDCAGVGYGVCGYGGMVWEGVEGAGM